MEKTILPHIPSTSDESLVDKNFKVGGTIEVISIGPKKTGSKIQTTYRQLPEVEIHENIDFGGANFRTNLSWLFIGSYWAPKISAIVVVSGIWEFYDQPNYGGSRWTLSPGYYNWVPDVGIPNDTIKSFKCIQLTV